MTISIPTFKVVTTLERKSGIERDRVQNTWHYLAPSQTPTSTNYGEWMGQWQLFMDDLHTSMSGCLGIGPEALRVEFFQLTAEKPPPGSGLGPPRSAGNMAWLTAPSAAGLPAEVSICLSLDGTTVLDSEGGPTGPRPAARKRNRKYIGPLGQGVVQAAASTLEAVVVPAIRSLILSAWDARMNVGMATKGWNPVVFSPTLWATNPIKTTWVNDAFDTQRRRGEDPTIKTEDVIEGSTAAYVARHQEFGIELHEDAMGVLRRV